MSQPILGQGRPIDLDLVFIKGEDFRLEMAWNDANGQPMPAAGTDMDLHFEASTLSGAYPDPAGHLTLVDGQVTVAYSAAETAGFDFVSIRWWIDKTGSDGRKMRWLQGRARLED